MSSGTDASTPLAQDPASALASNMFTKENANAAANYTSKKAVELRQQAVEGDLSVRLLGLFAGLAMVIGSVMGFIAKVLSFKFITAVLEVYTFLLGIMVIILESKALPFGKRLLANLYKYCYFLRFVWGRGALYFVAGSLQLVSGSIIDIAVGAFVMLIGILYIIVGRNTAAKLKKLRESMFSEKKLRSEFHAADLDGKGFLTISEFKVLVRNMGMDLSRREVESAFLQLDRDDKGTLSEQEFLAWWRQDDKDDYDFV